MFSFDPSFKIYGVDNQKELTSREREILMIEMQRVVQQIQQISVHYVQPGKAMTDFSDQIAAALDRLRL